MVRGLLHELQIRIVGVHTVEYSAFGRLYKNPHAKNRGCTILSAAPLLPSLPMLTSLQPAAYGCGQSSSSSQAEANSA